MSVLDRLFRHPPRRYLLPAALGVILTLLVLWRNGFGLKIAWVDALTVAGAVLILLGLLSLLAYHGAFDTFGYAFSTWGRRRWESLYAYSEAMREKRGRGGWTFVPTFVVGAAFLGVGLLLWVI